MKMYTLAYLIVATFLTAGYSSVTLADITGTTSVQATFTSTIEAGTCTAQIQSAGGQAISTLAFGDVFKSDLVAQSRSEAFKIAFSDCVGVKSASIQATSGNGGGCSGPDSDGDSFSAGNATGFEIWKGEADAGTLLSCNSKPAQNITISNSSVDVEMNARIVIAKTRTISDVTAGNVSAPVTFLVTYQ
ncbi:fimbrial protein [Citrobacter sp. U14242]|uniref:fimbrial protein n=1 Tax=Citrobacter sp. U14242 TaxID=3390192 RepID=UPI003978EA8B